MQLKLSRPLVCLDLEATGVDHTKDRIVEIGLVRLHPDGRRERLVERVDPGVDIPDNAARVHGIRTEEVRGLFGRPRLGRLAPQLLPMFEGADLCGYNIAAYDYPLWLAECRRHGLAFAPDARLLVDVMLIFHSRETTWDTFLMGPRNLTAALRHYCGRELVGAHSAAADADATLDVLMAQLSRYSDLPRDIAGLHEYCAAIHRQLMAAVQRQAAEAAARSSAAAR